MLLRKLSRESHRLGSRSSKRHKERQALPVEHAAHHPGVGSQPLLHVCTQPREASDASAAVIRECVGKVGVVVIVKVVSWSRHSLDVVVVISGGEDVRALQRGCESEAKREREKGAAPRRVF